MIPSLKVRKNGMRKGCRNKSLRQLSETAHSTEFILRCFRILLFAAELVLSEYGSTYIYI